MKFLCLGYLNASILDARPQEEIEAALLECSPHLEQLRKGGEVMIDAGVSPEAKCLRRANGKVEVTDGLYLGTKERIGSVFLIEAQDMEEAVRIASMHPSVQIDAGEQYEWGIEIRPIHYFWKRE